MIGINLVGSPNRKIPARSDIQAYYVWYVTQESGHMGQYVGKVAWFNNSKGYGFLTRREGPDVFCHYSAISGEGYKSLKDGDGVEFDVIQGEKGPQADHVVRTAKAPGPGDPSS